MSGANETGAVSGANETGAVSGADETGAVSGADEAGAVGGATRTEEPSDRGVGRGELGARELARWSWRQLTSMRTALVLLLLLALAAIPGSVIPQEGVDALEVSQWKDEHPTLTPVYEALDLFDVYASPWFSAIYLLLVLSLVGCIVPRTAVYWRALRAAPPRAPRHLTRLPEHAAYGTGERPEAVLARAATMLRERGYRVVPAGDAGSTASPDAVAAERGKLREAGNLLFHAALLLVVVGFALGSVLGFRGGVIVLVGGGFSNNLTQYDDFSPGSLFDTEDLDPFSFTVDDFDVEWIEEGRGRGMARKFVSHLTWTEEPGAEPQEYDLRVNHPLSIGDTDVFLIGHGYAPVVTVRDGNGDVVATGPTVFLPTDPSLQSFGVIKAPDGRPGEIGLEGVFYPFFVLSDGDPVNVMGDDRNPTLSMQVWTGDLGVNDGSPQSVYVLDKENATQVMDAEDPEKPLRLDLQPGQVAELPGGLGTVAFEGVQEWNRIQISRTPGTTLAFGGAVLALVGLMGSLFVRPRRAWVRARRHDGGTLVEVAVLDRSGGHDVAPEVTGIVAALQQGAPEDVAETVVEHDTEAEAEDDADD